MSRPRTDSFSGAATVAPSGPGAVSEPRQGLPSAAWTRAVRDMGRRVSPSARLVLYALAARANAEGRAWPSAAQLCDDTSLGRTAVWSALNELTQAGLVTRVPDGRKTATWELLLGIGGRPDMVRQTNDPAPVNRHPEATGEVPDRSSGEPSSFASRTINVREANNPPEAGAGSFASRKGSFASRTKIVRQAVSHLRDHEDDKKGADGGAGHRAPPPAPIAPDDEQIARIRKCDREFRGNGSTLRERYVCNSLLLDLGVSVSDAERDRLWSGLVEQWATTGKRPSAAIRALGAIGLSRGVSAVLDELAAAARPREAACG